MESKVKVLFDDFRKHTDSELWKSRTDLEAFIQKPGVIERYMNGEIGFNLLYTFKALAITNYLEGIVEVVASAISRLLKESNRNEDIELVEFFNSAICWDAKRITAILKNMESEVSASVTYDMAQFLSDDKLKNIAYYAFSSPTSFRYVLSKEQKNYVDRNLAIFGNDAPGVGRFLSNAHTSKLLRTPIPFESAKEGGKAKIF